MSNTLFPAQQLSLARKNKKWRKQCVDFADSMLHYNYNDIILSILHMEINYDLLAGKLHMDDLQLLCNPDGLKAGFIPDRILHYPIINTKLDVLKGEESKRVFDYRVIVTNPDGIAQIEENKRDAVFQALLEEILNTSQSDEEFNQKLEKLNDFFTYEWLDMREVTANYVLHHYEKEYNMPLIFTKGFNDALAVGEEIYQLDIVGGEPIVERVNPKKIRIYRSGSSNKVEDADMIVLEDYWSPGKVYDRYYDVLSKLDIEYLEELPNHFTSGAVDNMDNVDERFGFVNVNMASDTVDSTVFFDPFGKYSDSVTNNLMPFDMNGNVRVMRVYWKSRRKIKKIKFFNELGEEDFTFLAENYITDKFRGEEEEAFWVNEAWEGTKIGADIYVNMRPKVVLYNTLSNPSRCHFGIIGSIYNLNDDKPFSMVDRMKPFSYLYDVIHDRLNKMMARNWGKMTRLDLSKKPKSWDMNKWLYYAKTMGLFVENSFNEGTIGSATGKLAGALNSNSQGVIDADFGNNIQQYINLLEFIKMEMADCAGISKLREGQISNRETVGGVERATLLSSHITEWLFVVHDDVRKRVLEAFLETFKIAFRGRIKKFQYILPSYALKVFEVDGDIFAECDYGLVVDNSNGALELALKIETLALAALQNQTLSFSTIMKLFNSASLSEKQKYVEADEKRIQQLRELELQMAQLQLLQALQSQLQIALQEMQMKDLINQRDNETKIRVAQINSLAEFATLKLKNDMADDGILEPEEYSQEAKDNLMEKMRLFDETMKLNREKLDWEKDKERKSNELKLMLIRKQSNKK